MSIETRTYVITAESKLLDELEMAFKLAKPNAEIGVKKHTPPKTEPGGQSLPDNLDGSIPHI